MDIGRPQSFTGNLLLTILNSDFRGVDRDKRLSSTTRHRIFEPDIEESEFSHSERSPVVVWGCCGNKSNVLRG